MKITAKNNCDFADCVNNRAARFQAIPNAADVL